MTFLQTWQLEELFALAYLLIGVLYVAYFYTTFSLNRKDKTHINLQLEILFLDEHLREVEAEMVALRQYVGFYGRETNDL